MESQDPKLGDWLEYAKQYPPLEIEEVEHKRAELRVRFPHVVSLEGSYDGLDKAELYCWQQFGPRDGVCYDRSSVCLLPPRPVDPHHPPESGLTHSHEGIWTRYWIEKIDYDYGFFDLYFANEAHRLQFLNEFLSATSSGA